MGGTTSAGGGMGMRVRCGARLLVPASANRGEGRNLLRNVFSGTVCADYGFQVGPDGTKNLKGLLAITTKKFIDRHLESPVTLNRR